MDFSLIERILLKYVKSHPELVANLIEKLLDRLIARVQ